MRAPVVAVVALAGLVAAADLTGATAMRSSGTPAAPPSVAAVTSTSLVCPNLTGVPRGASTTVSIADLAGALTPPSRSTGGVTVRALNGAAAKPSPLSPTPVARVRSRPGHYQALAVSATGSVAASLAADQVTEIPQGRQRALSDARCETPGVDWWFAGADGRVGFTDTLFLANPSGTPARVAVSLLSSKGPLSPAHLDSLDVPAYSRVTEPIAAIAPDAATLALHVHATSGAVTAALGDVRTTALKPAGSDYLPATAAPARSQTVPGFLPGAGSRTVVIADPGGNDATVSLRLVTASGSFVPSGTSQVVVRSGRTAAVDLTRPMSGSTGAVLLSSDRPIIAEGRSVQPAAGKLPDLQWQPAQPPLRGPAAVAGTGEPDGGSCLLLLSAPSGAAQVVVRTPAGRGRTVSVPAGHSTGVDLTSTVGAGAGAAPFVVSTSGGPVYATRVLRFGGTHGALVAAEPVTALPASIVLPPVREDPRVAIR
jgi:hypothetical protein